MIGYSRPGVPPVVIARKRAAIVRSLAEQAKAKRALTRTIERKDSSAIIERGLAFGQAANRTARLVRSLERTIGRS